MKKSSILITISLFCTLFIAFGIYNLYRGYQSGRWPTVEGVVLSSQISKHRSTGSNRHKTFYKASINYQYELGGKKYCNNTISYKGENTSHSSATSELQKYPTNSRVAVYYNPENPKQSLLDPGIGNWNFFLIVLPLVIWFLFYLGIRRGQIIVNGKTVMLK